MADIYTCPPTAAAMARYLGLAELRLAGTTPCVPSVVDAPPGPSLDALTAYATVAYGAAATVRPIGSVPPARRSALWAAAPVVSRPVAPAPADTPPNEPSSKAPDDRERAPGER